MMRIQDLRHTYASHYMMNGGSLGDLQGLLGHAKPDMTQKYAHLAPLHLAGKSSVVAMSCGKAAAPISDIRRFAKPPGESEWNRSP
jgi:hypothetical protein